MNIFAGINYWAVTVVSVIYYIIGFLWYTKLFGEPWRKETGASGNEKPQASSLIGQFLSTFLFTLGIAILLKLTNATGLKDAICTSAILTVFFVIPIHSGNLFFTNKKRLFFIDVCERALGILIISMILCLWK